MRKVVVRKRASYEADAIESVRHNRENSNCACWWLVAASCCCSLLAARCCMVHLARSSKEETAPSRRNHVFVGLVEEYKVLGPRYKYQTTSTWVPGTENTVASSENVM